MIVSGEASRTAACDLINDTKTGPTEFRTSENVGKTAQVDGVEYGKKKK
jgi:hypothetical protein